MFQRKFSIAPGNRSGPGVLILRAMTRAAVVIVAGLGLAACVGPYDDGYGHSQTQYRVGASYDTGYDQRHGTVYRRYPYASSDDRRWYYSPNRGSDYPRYRYDY